MKKIQRVGLGLALLAVLAGGGVPASAKSSNKQRTLNGVVRNVDLRARTVEVREHETGRVVSMRVPDGALVRTNVTSQPLVQIERLLPGMVVRGVVR
jgi:hypothetical protein